LFEEAEHNAQVKAVVLTGNAQCFAAGADLSELAAMDAVTLQLDIRPSFGKKLMRLVSH
jgi:enoyl-CoA hydratase/carnithine racemase